jgi:hypothetical protein
MAALLKLSNTDMSPFVCGLPLGTISLALFWTSVQRNPKSPQVVPENDSSKGLAAPSWSWANSRQWRKGIVYPPHLSEAYRTYRAMGTTGHAKLIGIEVFDQEAAAAFSTMDSRPIGMNLEWTEKESWSKLPVDIYAVLRIKAYAAPWFPEFTCQDMDPYRLFEKISNAWKAVICFDSGTGKDVNRIRRARVQRVILDAAL